MKFLSIIAHVRLVFLMLCFLGLALGQEVPVITQASGIRSLTQGDAVKRLPLKIRGVVTWTGIESVVIQDESGGAYVAKGDLIGESVWQGDDSIFGRLRPGLEVEVDGVTELGGFSPMVLARTISITGEKALPIPQPMVAAVFFGGSQDCERVEVRGVVQGFRIHKNGVTLNLSVNPGRVRAFTRVADLPDLANLVDAVVRIIGVKIGGLNARGEAPFPQVEFLDAGDLVIEKAARYGAFDVPKLDRGGIAQFRDEPFNGHRMRFEGVVTYVGADQLLYVQFGKLGIRVKTRERESLQIGDYIEVSGFPDEKVPICGIEQAVVRKLGFRQLSPPYEIEPQQIIEHNLSLFGLSKKGNQQDYDGQLIHFEGKLVEVVNTVSGQFRLVLATKSSVVFALINQAEMETQGRPGNGSILSVTGIAQQIYEGEPSLSGYMVPTRIDVLLRDRNDIKVVKPPPIWNVQRLSWALAVIFVLLGLGALWIGQLKRGIKRQTKRWERTLLAHRNVELEWKGAREERYRLAGDLHDGLQQHLTGVTFRLEAALLRMGEQAPDVEEQFTATRSALERTRRELRECLLGLRSVEEGPAEFPELLRHAIGKMEHWPKGAVEISVIGEPFALSRHVMGTLLLFMQEAVGNAFNHGAATRVQIDLHFLPDAFEMHVNDNGSGFDPSLMPDASAGHFGVESMRYRIRWLGGSLSFQSQPGEGTQVLAKLPRNRAEEQTEPFEIDHETS